MDEKHIVNKDTKPRKVRRDPLSGYVPFIPCSGNFRDAYNIFACISPDPSKGKACYYHITRNNGTAVSFLFFVERLVASKFLRHNEVLIMDNAAIHVGGEASIIEDLLWNTIIDGRPLQILTVFLPTRAPELNPIELVFHVLARRIRSFRYQNAFLDDATVVTKTATVLDGISPDLILRMMCHCGYGFPHYN